MISLIGLGVKAGDLSYSALKELKSGKKVFVRTEQVDAIEVLKQENINFVSLDYLYDCSKNFNTLNKKIYSTLLKEHKLGDICYCVDGDVLEDTVCKKLLGKKYVKAYNGVSKSSNVLSVCGLGGAYTSVSAHEINLLSDNVVCPLVVYDLDDLLVAGNVKLKLSDYFGDETQIYFVSGQKAKKIPLYQIDWQKEYSYKTALVIPEQKLIDKKRFNFDDLLEIIRVLRGENGCPWDKVQTKESITKNLIEECYELVDAIKLDDEGKMQEEIGDNLLQCAFHIIFAEERETFNKNDVLSEICSKLIFRHSHVFGSDSAQNSNDALSVWEKNKVIEKNMTTALDTVKDVPKCFPSLMRAQKVYKRAVKGGYKKYTKQEILSKIKATDNVGDILLFSAMLCYVLDLDAEEILYDKIESFIVELSKVLV